MYVYICMYTIYHKEPYHTIAIITNVFGNLSSWVQQSACIVERLLIVLANDEPSSLPERVAADTTIGLVLTPFLAVADLNLVANKMSHVKQMNGLSPSFKRLRHIFKCRSVWHLIFYCFNEDAISDFNSRTNSKSPLPAGDDLCHDKPATAILSFSFKIVLLLLIVLLWVF